MANAYEEARLKRLEDNKKKFADLGISKISKTLLELKKCEKAQQRISKPKITEYVEPRRSSRARNSITSYVDEFDMGERTIRKRSKTNSSWTSYLSRPVDEVKFATYEERVHALKKAEDLQSILQSGTPSFVKSMVRSHVYSCFWLGLPSRFCDDYLPKTSMDMVLENVNGDEYEAVYIGKRAGLSGGWRAFALEHKLDDGDALVFDLVEPARFKVYIVKATHHLSEGDDVEGKKKKQSGAKKISKGGKKVGQKNGIKPKYRKKSDISPETSLSSSSDSEEYESSISKDSPKSGSKPKKESSTSEDSPESGSNPKKESSISKDSSENGSNPKKLQDSGASRRSARLSRKRE